MDGQMRVENIPTAQVAAPTVEMRETMTHEGIEELMQSIKEIGIRQALTVKRRGDGYEVVAGARRLECARRLGLLTVPCVVEDADARRMEIIKIHENLKREDVDPVEEAAYYRRLVDEMGFSLDDLARATGRWYEYLEGRLAICKWDAQIKEAVKAKAITLAVAKELMKFPDEETRGRYLAAGANNGVTARTMESWRLQWEAERDSGAKPPEGVEAATAAPVPYVPKQFCALCGENLHGMITFFVPVSQKCLDMMNEGKAEALRGGGGAAPGR